MTRAPGEGRVKSGDRRNWGGQVESFDYKYDDSDSPEAPQSFMSITGTVPPGEISVKAGNDVSLQTGSGSGGQVEDVGELQTQMFDYIRPTEIGPEYGTWKRAFDGTNETTKYLNPRTKMNGDKDGRSAESIARLDPIYGNINVLSGAESPGSITTAAPATSRKPEMAHQNGRFGDGKIDGGRSLALNDLQREGQGQQQGENKPRSTSRNSAFMGYEAPPTDTTWMAKSDPAEKDSDEFDLLENMEKESGEVDGEEDFGLRESIVSSSESSRLARVDGEGRKNGSSTFFSRLFGRGASGGGGGRAQSSGREAPENPEPAKPSAPKDIERYPGHPATTSPSLRGGEERTADPLSAIRFSFGELDAKSTVTGGGTVVGERKTREETAESFAAFAGGKIATDTQIKTDQKGNRDLSFQWQDSGQSNKSLAFRLSRSNRRPTSMPLRQEM